MRTADASLRLEAHRLKWLKNDRRGPLLSFYDLTEAEKQFFIEELTRDAAVRRLNVSNKEDEQMFDKMFLSIISEWGVMCPHVVTFVKDTAHGRRCSTCGCDIIPSPKKRSPAKVGR